MNLNESTELGSTVMLSILTVNSSHRGAEREGSSKGPQSLGCDSAVLTLDQ